MSNCSGASKSLFIQPTPHNSHISTSTSPQASCLYCWTIHADTFAWFHSASWSFENGTWKSSRQASQSWLDIGLIPRHWWQMCNTLEKEGAQCKENHFEIRNYQGRSEQPFKARVSPDKAQMCSKSCPPSAHSGEGWRCLCGIFLLESLRASGNVLCRLSSIHLHTHLHRCAPTQIYSSTHLHTHLHRCAPTQIYKLWPGLTAQGMSSTRFCRCASKAHCNESPLWGNSCGCRLHLNHHRGLKSQLFFQTGQSHLSETFCADVFLHFYGMFL